jgi:hypothetical protein
MNRWNVGAAGALLLALAVGYGFTRNNHEDITFARIQDAKARLAKSGFYCTTDCANGQISCGFMLSRKASSWSEVCTMRKSGAMGPEWQGKVWVTLNPQAWQIESIPDQAGVRVWGAVVAFGDDEFLREIEAAL